jgi:hypothetical protein
MRAMQPSRSARPDFPDKGAEYFMSSRSTRLIGMVE